jgi:hypothetical protein
MDVDDGNVLLHFLALIIGLIGLTAMAFIMVFLLVWGIFLTTEYLEKHCPHRRP